MSPILLTGDAQTQVNFLLGPWIIGCSADLVLQGALCVQFVNYFTWYRDDKRGLKAAVAGLCLLTSLKTIQSFVIIWNHAIVHFDDLQGAIQLNFSTWWEAGTPLMGAVIEIYVQSYFCYRLYAISRTVYVVAPLVVIFFFAFSATVLATYHITQHDTTVIASWFTAHLSAVFAGDLLLTTTSAFFLIKTRKRAVSETADLIDRLIRLTFQTAAPASLCAMLNLIFAVTFVGSKALFSNVFQVPLPKLYAVSMMYTLNARRDIRASRGGQLSSSEGRGISRPHNLSGGMELSQIFTPTHTQPEHHVDVRATLGRADMKSVPHFALA
ncbi:hypothetical protein DFH06DRAFT_1484799 [Mycena polygramma]|nr:hypothetical protein DFH06DRAFT_1484799 [Mycena polygramma]